MLSLSRLTPFVSISNNVDISHPLLTLMGSGIFILPALQKLKELLCASFLEKTHQRAPDSLHLGTWYLGDLSITIDKASCNLLELEVPGDIGMDKNLGQLSRSDDELGYEVDSIVTVATKLRGRCLVGPELAIELRSKDLSGVATRKSERNVLV